MTKIDKLERKIMEGKEYSFEINQVSVAKIELMTCEYKTPGINYDLDGKLKKPIISLLLVLNKIMDKIVYGQIQSYFVQNK